MFRAVCLNERTRKYLSATSMSFFNIKTFKRVMVKSREIRIQPIPKRRPELLLEAPQNAYK